jgi:cyanophycin synthetase
MRILEQRALRGPNMWSRFPTAYMRIDLEGFADRPTNSLPGFTDLLMELLPSLYEHRCGVGRAGGFESRMIEGTWLGLREPHDRGNLAGARNRARGH